MNNIFSYVLKKWITSRYEKFEWSIWVPSCSRIFCLFLIVRLQYVNCCIIILMQANLMYITKAANSSNGLEFLCLLSHLIKYFLLLNDLLLIRVINCNLYSYNVTNKCVLIRKKYFLLKYAIEYWKNHKIYFRIHIDMFNFRLLNL